MGFSNWSDDTYNSLSKGYVGKSADEIFSDKEDKDMSPVELDIRESRDSDDHPESLAVMVCLDETGSMGRIPETIAREKLGALMSTIIDNGVKDPQILFAGIGDHVTDRSPLQVGQFESGPEELDKWLSSIFLEGYGGGQGMESYLLAWLVAGRHTSIDCFEKRGTKGFLFTIGDEKSWDNLDPNSLRKILGYKETDTLTDKQLLEEAQRMYNVYHIHINEGSYENDQRVFKYWKDLLGERFIVLEDHRVICETIATIIAMQHGIDLSDVVGAFDAKTKGIVSNALAHVTNTITSAPGGIVSNGEKGVGEL